MRLASLIPVLALGLISGCNGGGSSSSATPSGPTQQEKEQALGFSAILVEELSLYYTPEAWNPPALISVGPASAGNLAALVSHARNPRMPLPTRRVQVETPCTGTTTTGPPDQDGYITAVTDYVGCADGTMGQIVTRWKLTSSLFDLSVTYHDLQSQYLQGGIQTTQTLNGSISVVANHSGGVWTAHFNIPGLVAVATGGGSTLQLTHTADFTETFTQTSPAGQPPVYGDFSVFGSSAWDSGVVRFSASVAQGSPLVWKDRGLPGACTYPVSGRVVHSLNGRSIGVTFTSACGTVRLDDGTTYDLGLF